MIGLFSEQRGEERFYLMLSSQSCFNRVGRFPSDEKIIEEANRSEWNHLLSDDYMQKQECETRFGTYCKVAERLLKSATIVEQFLRDQNGAAAQE